MDKLKLDSFLALARDLGVRGFAQQEGTVFIKTESESIYENKDVSSNRYSGLIS